MNLNCKRLLAKYFIIVVDALKLLTFLFIFSNNIIQRSTQLLQNIQTGAAVPARVAPPMTTTSTHPPITSPNHPLNSGVPRVHRRATNSIPTQYSIPSIPGIPSNAYNGQFNNYGYRGMTNMNIGGFNPYNTFGQLPNTPFTNP